jgi:hypothetical protein
MQGIRRTDPARPWLRRLVSGLGLCGAVCTVVFFGCREDVGTQIDRNRAPDTYLTGFPADSTTSTYRIHLFWYGSDIDGRVVGYEWAVTDSAPLAEDTITYRFTTRTDSVFRMQVGSTQQVLAHRFYIRAIDNEGKVDPTPARTFFGSVDLVPPLPVFTLSEGFRNGFPAIPIEASDITVPRDTIDAGYDVRFHWKGVDGDRVVLESGAIDTVGQVVAFEHWLTPVQTAPIRGDLSDSAVTFTNLQSGKYVFNLRAVDDAGFAGLDPVTRPFVWNRDPKTYFLTGFDAAAPGGGAYKVRLTAISPAWPDSLVFFEGDTLPLPSINGVPIAIDVRARIYGVDPDDFLGRGVSGFQFRGGVGAWESADTTENAQRPFASLTQLQTSDVVLQARCSDGYGRRDGSPAETYFTVNRAPVLLDTLQIVDGVPVYQYPRRGQEIRLEEIAAAGWTMRVRVLAFDRDATTNRFAYFFRAGGFIYSDQITPQPGQICEYAFQVRPEWRQPGTYAIGVRIEELGYGVPHRKVDLEIPFRFVN